MKRSTAALVLACLTGMAAAGPGRADPPRATAPATVVPGCEDFARRLPNVSRALCMAAGLQPGSGRSVRGVPLYTRDIQPEGAKLRVLVTGAIHGDELSSASLALHWIALAQQPTQMPQPVHWRFVPVLNPDGVLHQPPRRMNANGVDLNRNFHDFSRPLPDNTAYRELQALLLPAQWPPSDDNNAAISQYIATHGEPAYQAAISRGQHEFPGGLFFGGTGPTWSNSTLREVLRSYGFLVSLMGCIDIYTGLGPSGLGERIYAGADDDVTKPFHVEEVLARIRALIRRAAGHASSEIVCGPVRLDTKSSKAVVNGVTLKLTSHEYRLLSYLMHHMGEVVSRTELVEHLYDQDFDRDSNTIEVFVGRLRKKIGIDMIETVRGLGYRIQAPAA